MMKLPVKSFSLACALTLTSVGSYAQQPLKIGFLGTLSGPAGALGQDQYDAFMLGIEHLGGKLGNSTVQVLKEDDQLKPDLGVELAKKLIEKEKVGIITGVTFSNVMMAVHKPITDSGVFLIGSNAGPTPITGKGCSPMYFSTSWNNDSLHESMGAYAREQGYKRVYLMAPNYQAGKDALAGFKAQYKGTALDEVYTQINQPDYSAEIAQMQAAGWGGAGSVQDQPTAQRSIKAFCAPSMMNSMSYPQYDIPKVFRSSNSSSSTLNANDLNSFDEYEIPHFLRKQADEDLSIPLSPQQVIDIANFEIDEAEDFDEFIKAINSQKLDKELVKIIKNLNKFLSDKDAWLVILYWLSIQFEDDTDWNELTRTSIEQLGNNLKPDDLAKGLSYLNGELTTVNIRYW